MQLQSLSTTWLNPSVWACTLLSKQQPTPDVLAHHPLIHTRPWLRCSVAVPGNKVLDVQTAAAGNQPFSAGMHTFALEWARDSITSELVDYSLCPAALLLLLLLLPSLPQLLL